MAPLAPGSPGYHAALVAARERAVARLTQALDAVLLPQGFRRKGGRWSRTGWFATTFVEIQKSKFGTACYLNLGRDPANRDWRQPSYREGSFWRLGRLTGRIAEANRLDQLDYLALDADPALLAEVADLVAGRAIPFLKRCQGPFGFAARPPSLRRE
jgi:hypothetical protein